MASVPSEASWLSQTLGCSGGEAFRPPAKLERVVLSAMQSDA